MSHLDKLLHAWGNNRGGFPKSASALLIIIFKLAQKTSHLPSPLQLVIATRSFINNYEINKSPFIKNYGNKNAKQLIATTTKYESKAFKKKVSVIFLPIVFKWFTKKVKKL